MSDERPCALCLEAFEAGSLRERYGLDICEPCRTGSAAERVKPVGIEVTTERRQNQDDAAYLVEARATWRTTGRVQFTRQGRGSRFLKLFIDELEVGDPKFDDAVWVQPLAKHDDVGDVLFDDPPLASPRERMATKGLLASKGVQSAIVTIVGLPYGYARIEPGVVRSAIKASASQEDRDAQILAVCAIVRLLQRD